MSNSCGKRPLSQGTPSPSTEQAKKILKMAEGNESTTGEAISQALSQVFPNSPDSAKDDSSSHFLKMFEITEEQARALSSGEEKWELLVRSLRSISDEVLALRNENANLKHSLHSAKGQIIKLDNQIIQYQEKLMEV